MKIIKEIIGYLFEGVLYEDINDLEGRTMWEENKLKQVYSETEDAKEN